MSAFQLYRLPQIQNSSKASTPLRCSPDMNDLNLLQRDGATAVVDLAMQFADRGYQCDIELMSQVIGRLSDIQVRDFALGTHNAKTFDTYWNMWLYLLRVAPVGFVASRCMFICNFGV